MRTQSNFLSPQSAPAFRRPAAHQPLHALFGGPLTLAPGLVPLTTSESVLLVSETRSVEFSGPVWPLLILLLDGHRTATDVVKELRDRFSPPEVLEALGVLAQEGVLTAEPVAASARGAPGLDADRNAVEIHIAGAGSEFLKQSLAELGVIERGPAEPAMLDVVILDSYLALPESEFVHRNRAWLPVKLAGEVAWIGPFFRPGEGACWKCLEHRLSRTREAHVLAEDGRAIRTTGAGALAAARVCALQIARWLDCPGDPAHPLLDHLATVDAHSLQIDLHPVVRRPQCPACGSGTLQEPQPLRIEAGLDQGEVRPGEQSEQALLDRFAHHVDEITGLITALEPVAGDPVHVCRSRYVRPIAAKTAERAIEHYRLVAAGKGTSAIAARAGALAEALERYSSTWDGSEPLVVAPLESLGDECVHPNDCMLFSEQQLARGSEGAGIKSHVPARFDVHEPVGWLRAWSISRNTWRYVAAGWALMGYKGPGASYAIGDSNGNAAGASIEDAILRGVCELIERDGVALWWYNRARRPGVDLEGFEPEYIGRLAEHYRSIGREFWILDLTSDLGVPTFAAVSQCTQGAPATPVVAFGAHLDARTAVLRALAEMNQMLPHALARAPREDRPPPASWRNDSMALATLDAHQYLLPDHSLALTRPDAFSTPSQASLDSQIGWIGERLERSRLELMVLDLTRPDVGLPVVRVIVPGLRHFWRRLAPGRLYEVPASLGWCSQLTPERDVNPLELAI